MNIWIRPIVVAAAALVAAGVPATVDGSVSLNDAFVMLSAGIGTFATGAGFTVNSTRSPAQLRGIAARLQRHVAPRRVHAEVDAALHGSHVVPSIHSDTP